MSVWADLVGQQRVVDVLRRAVAGGPHAMTHAWLITGPPGSGRSNAARSFAAAITSGVSTVAVVLSALANEPPLPKAKGAKRAQSGPMQKPPNLPAFWRASAAALRSSQVQSAVGSAMPASAKASGR